MLPVLLLLLLAPASPDVDTSRLLRCTSARGHRDPGLRCGDQVGCDWWREARLASCDWSVQGDLPLVPGGQGPGLRLRPPLLRPEALRQLHLLGRGGLQEARRGGRGHQGLPT